MECGCRVRSAVLNVERSAECGVHRVKCGEWSAECKVWAVEWRVWSGEWGVGSVKCEC